MRLQLLKRGVDRGLRIGALAAMSDDELTETLSARHNQANSLLDPYLDAIADMDSERLESMLSTYLFADGPNSFAQNLMMPLMREVGERWADGKLSVAAEHMVSTTARTLLGIALKNNKYQSSSTKALFATPIGELHELGVLTAAIIAQSEGVHAVFLGSQMPAAELANAAHTMNASIVCLGCATLNPNLLNLEVSRVRQQLPNHVSLWLGGRSIVGTKVDVDGVRTFADLPSFADALAAYK